VTRSLWRSSSGTDSQALTAGVPQTVATEEPPRFRPSSTPASSSRTVTANGGLLPFWGAALVVTGYGLALAAAGTRLITHRQIT
jgi:hypothetical protein